jgi:hypothetical protein
VQAICHSRESGNPWLFVGDTRPGGLVCPESFFTYMPGCRTAFASNPNPKGLGHPAICHSRESGNPWLFVGGTRPGGLVCPESTFLWAADALVCPESFFTYMTGCRTAFASNPNPKGLGHPDASLALDEK